MKDRKAFKESMVMMASVFNFGLEEIHLKTYWRVLDSMSDGQFSEAVDKWLTQGKFFPRPAELLDMIETSAQSAGDAWALVLKEIRDYQSANLPDDIQSAVDEIGGLQMLAHCQESELPFRAQDFRKAYRPNRSNLLKEKIEADPRFKSLGQLTGKVS